MAGHSAFHERLLLVSRHRHGMRWCTHIGWRAVPVPGHVLHHRHVRVHRRGVGLRSRHCPSSIQIGNARTHACMRHGTPARIEDRWLPRQAAPTRHDARRRRGRLPPLAHGPPWHRSCAPTCRAHAPRRTTPRGGARATNGMAVSAPTTQRPDVELPTAGWGGGMNV